MRSFALLVMAIAASMFLSGPVYAGDQYRPDPQPSAAANDPRQAIVFVMGDPDCNWNYMWTGTAFVIGSEPIKTTEGSARYLLRFMTAGHVIHGARCIEIQFYDGRLVRIEPHAVDFHLYSNDVFVFDAVLGHPSAQLILDPVVPDWGAEVSSIGFPNGEPWQLLTGHVSGNMEKIDTSVGSYQCLPISMPGFYYGISGAPVFDARGGVFGVADAVNVGSMNNETLTGFVALIPASE